MASLKESLNYIHQIVNAEENICANNVILANLRSRQKNDNCTGEIDSCFTKSSCANCHKQGVCLL